MLTGSEEMPAPHIFCPILHDERVASTDNVSMDASALTSEPDVSHKEKSITGAAVFCIL